MLKRKISAYLKNLKKIVAQLRVLRKLKLQDRLDINAKPTVLNLNIIDSCNSRCTMCNIWKQDEELEISPEELHIILEDPLYSELKYVGVTGGEPTLREDLPAIYATIIDTLPNLKGVSIITNAIRENEVIKRITEVNEICKSKGVSFSAMVSLDGVGSAHDRVRGIKNNFESSMKVFRYIQDELHIPTSFGCTISKINAWDADDLLYYAKKNGMYGRFRVAETINRLYNQDRGKVIRNFNKDETYNLLLFFEKLKHTYETNGTYKRTYSSIQSVLSGNDRLIGCPYHNDGIVLGSKGQVNYCAPQATDLGNALEASSRQIYRDNFSEKINILKNDCKNCIHDYHAPISYTEKRKEILSSYTKRFLHIKKAQKALWLSKLLKKIPKNSNRYRVFIVGWYGTETVGDKAILGGIVDYYTNKYNNEVEFVIGSLFPFVSEKTCEELDIDAKVVSTQSVDLLRYSKSSDEVVMGGGPLMDLSVLYVPLLAFRIGKYFGAITTIFGCGIGPLKKKKYKNTVIDIFKFADEVKLRDKKSLTWYESLKFKTKGILIGDPAKDYIKRIERTVTVNEAESVLCCYLRDWTFEYFYGTKEDFKVQKDQFERGIAKLIREKANELSVDKIEFHHMHNFVMGNDDRDFSRYFTDKFFPNDERVYIEKGLSSVVSIISSMKIAQLNICMRFHSVLFAHTLQTDFLAIDYTMGGKI